VDAINKILRGPAVIAESGGAGGGGRAILTPIGEKLIQHYHSIAMRTRVAARSEFEALSKLVRG
jgi:molybdate transport repressor ModE-like protein